MPRRAHLAAALALTGFGLVACVMPTALEPSEIDRGSLATIDDFRGWLGEADAAARK